MAFRFLVALLELGHGSPNVADREQTRRKRVIQVGRVVGYLVGEIDELGLQGWAQTGKVFIQRRILTLSEVARMFDDPFPQLEGEVQPRKARITVLESFDHSQRMQIVIETFAEPAHLPVQFLLAGVGEGRMADVVAQRERLGQIFIQCQNRSHCTRDLRNFDGVGQPVAEMVGDSGWKNLHFILQPAEGAGVDDAIAIALEFVTVGMRKLGIAAAAAPVHREAQAGERVPFWVMSPSALIATRLILLRGLLRNGSSNLRARCGSLDSINSASTIVAASLETRGVGWSINDCRSF